MGMSRSAVLVVSRIRASERMHEVVESIRQQVGRQYGLGTWEKFFYRHDHGMCSPCRRYYELLDACPVRIPHPQHVAVLRE